jgi:short/branched chain acyl-CoA dehydrogenase
MSLRSSTTSLLRNAARAGPRNGLSLSASLARSSRVNAASALAITPQVSRACFSTSRSTLDEFESPFGVNSLAKLTEEEEMLREAVKRFAEEVVAPKVLEMDEKELMDPEIIKGLFEQGLMGVETSEEHNGAGGSFTAAIIVIEGGFSCLYGLLVTC